LSLPRLAPGASLIRTSLFSTLNVTLGSLPQTTQEGTSQLVEKLANEINLLSAELVDLRAVNQVSSESAAGISRIFSA
jgi:hypothetical protein